MNGRPIFLKFYIRHCAGKACTVILLLSAGCMKFHWTFIAVVCLIHCHHRMRHAAHKFSGVCALSAADDVLPLRLCVTEDKDGLYAVTLKVPDDVPDRRLEHWRWLHAWTSLLWTVPKKYYPEH